jgi:hypothetical protein
MHLCIKCIFVAMVCISYLRQHVTVSSYTRGIFNAWWLLADVHEFRHRQATLTVAHVCPSVFSDVGSNRGTE